MEVFQGTDSTNPAQFCCLDSLKVKPATFPKHSSQIFPLLVHVPFENHVFLLIYLVTQCLYLYVCLTYYMLLTFVKFKNRNY